MIYMLVPIWAEFHDIRLFTTYSAMEDVVLKFARSRKERNVPVEWCIVLAFDGGDELDPVWNYHINSVTLRLDRVPASR